MFEYKHYKLYKNNSIKDSRGNVKQEYIEIDKIRGMIVKRDKVLFQTEKGYSTTDEKILITSRMYIDKLKRGYKIDDLIITDINVNGSDIVCNLEMI